MDRERVGMNRIPKERMFGKKTSRVGIVCAGICAMAAFRVLSYGVIYLDMLYEAVLCVGFGLWGISLSERVIERRPRHLFELLAWSMVSLSVLKIVRYHYLFTPTARRLFWYAYYIPMIAMALLSLLIAGCSREFGKDSYHSLHWAGVPAIVFAFLILTNDLHQWVFQFPNGLILGDTSYRYGWLYYLLLGYLAVLVLGALGQIFVRCSFKQSRRKAPMLFLCVGFGMLYFAAYSLGIEFRIHGIALINLPDAICLFVVLLWECCISIGLYPVNTGYDRIFSESGLYAVLTDREGRIVYTSVPAKTINNREAAEHLRLQHHPVSGGTLSYYEDLSELIRLREELEEATEVINGENLLIEAENRLREDALRLQTLNHVYDNIAYEVHPRVIAIESLLKDAAAEMNEETFRKQLERACVLNAYIKRKSNLILQMLQAEYLDVMELYLAIQESLQYLSLYGIRAVLLPGLPEVELPGELLCKAYDYFQELIENCGDSFHQAAIRISATEEGLTLRYLMVPSFDQSLLPAAGETVNVLAEEDGTIVIWHLSVKGGQHDEQY